MVWSKVFALACFTFVFSLTVASDSDSQSGSDSGSSDEGTTLIVWHCVAVTACAFVKLMVK